MAVSANQVIKMRGPARRRKVPVAANAVLYEGTMCFEDAGGDFAAAVVEDGSFGGIVIKAVDNTGGTDASAGGFGAKFAEVYVSGEFLLPMNSTTLTAADIGKPLYGSDNYTLTETATDLVPVGIVTEVVSSSLAWVAIHGLGETEAGERAT